MCFGCLQARVFILERSPLLDPLSVSHRRRRHVKDLRDVHVAPCLWPHVVAQSRQHVSYPEVAGLDSTRPTLHSPEQEA